ncbi:MAG: sugar phosphate isomerase/epimerase family protein [Limisphaerales bacterium]
MNTPSYTTSIPLTRRSFLASAAVSVTGLALGESGLMAADTRSPCPVTVFSKVYQELKLDFAAAAEITAEAGLDGVDCPVRPGGEVEPEHAADQLPRYSETLERLNLKIWLLTTGILSPATPFTESILRTAKMLGINCYRLDFIKREPAEPEKQMREIRAHLKDLAALNRELGLCALLENHSPVGKTVYFGGDLSEMAAAVESFDPAEIGIAFDIGHALVVHGAEWRTHFERLRPHFKIAYVKDVKRGAGWVRFGDGEIGSSGYFELLRSIGYHAPVSMHIEYDWSDHGTHKSRADLLQVLKDNSKVLRGWLAGVR